MYTYIYIYKGYPRRGITVARLSTSGGTRGIGGGTAPIGVNHTTLNRSPAVRGLFILT